ncbi:MAG: cation transporter, partial [Anaerolineae bacterium]|nr:cation transporter [Anaerolineae bacterium]
MSECGCEIEIRDESQRKVLIVLLAINATMFIFELGLGWYAESTGLIADSMDMLADAIVYGIGL